MSGSPKSEIFVDITSQFMSVWQCRSQKSEGLPMKDDWVQMSRDQCSKTLAIFGIQNNKFHPKPTKVSIPFIPLSNKKKLQKAISNNYQSEHIELTYVEQFRTVKGSSTEPHTSVHIWIYLLVHLSEDLFVVKIFIQLLFHRHISFKWLLSGTQN